MSGRIDRRFAALAEEGRAGLVTFTMMGDPDIETSYEILEGLADAGADVIEIGSPFTDPMADGPVIQRAGQRALAAGITLTKTLGLVRRFRARDGETPLVLMGYYNPIYIYGVERFLADALEVGLDGMIVVDLPPEEDAELCRPALDAGLSFVRLTAPTTDEARLPAVLTNTRRLRLLHLDHRDYRRGWCGLRSDAEGRRAAATPHHASHRGGLRHQDARPGGRGREGGGRCGCRLSARRGDRGGVGLRRRGNARLPR